VDRELEVIRDEMEQTRANLADKLGALEEQVQKTVTSASETVTSTVEGVKEVVDTVSETVGSVTETFNISKKVEEHPLLSMGIALAAGFALGQLTGGSSRPVVVQPPPQPTPPQPSHEPRFQFPEQMSQPSVPTPSAPPAHDKAANKSDSMLPSLESLKSMLPESMLPSLESLLPELQGICNTVVSGMGGLAVGSVMGAVRELVAQGLPKEWTGEINNLVDQVTRQLGGKPQPPKQESDGQQRDGSPDASKESGKANGKQAVRTAPMA